MCNEAARCIALDQLRADWGQTRIPLVFPEGLPNMAPLESVRITDASVIIRRAADRQGDAAAAELVTRRWSWPGPQGKPVYNFRSDGRRLVEGRCLIPVSGFYEHTDPEPLSPEDNALPKKRAPKTKWLFTMPGLDWFCIAGLWRGGVAVKGETVEAWTMLTCPPGPDIVPYHARQVVVLRPEQWALWLDPAVPSADLCRPLPEGSLAVERVR